MSQTTDSVAAGAEDAAAPRPAWRRVLDGVGVQNLSLLIALGILVAIIGSQQSGFFLAANIETIGTAVAVTGLLSLVETVVIILGGLDISVGSLAGLSSVASAMIFTALDANAMFGIVGALLIGLACGLLNGCVIVFGRVNPVVATLATLAAFKGLAQLISDGRAQGYTGTNAVFIFIARGAILGIPTLIWVFAAVAVVIHIVLRYSDIGRNIYAIGGNETAARLAGININKYILAVYACSGVVAALAGLLITARTGSGQPVSGSEGTELEAVTGAALGGCVMKGGKGSVVGTVLAVILLGVLTNGMTLLGINPFWQNVAKGTLLVVAVIIQQLRSGERRVGLPA